MINSKRKAKSGFSLIELIIVLAVMAIIALIAVPNFTEVRENSKNKADQQSMEVIKRIMLVAETEFELPTGQGVNIYFEENGKVYLSCTKGVSKEIEDYLTEQFSQVKRPQGMSTILFPGDKEDRATAYSISIGGNGNITIGTFKSKESQG